MPDAQLSSKQSNDLVARLRHLEKYEWNSCSEDYGAQMTIAMGREVLAEIERLTRAKADWEECVALRDAEIERLTREREVLRGKLVATEGELAAIGRERDTLELWVRDHHGIEERLRAALVRAEEGLQCGGHRDRDHYCPNCDNSLWPVRKGLQDARDGAVETTKSLGPPDCICPKCGAYIMNPWDEPRVADKTD